jgi:hypothetical protein
MLCPKLWSSKRYADLLVPLGFGSRMITQVDV